MRVAAALFATIVATPAAAAPIDLSDPTSRNVLVRFEVSDEFLEEDLRLAHEDFGDPVRVAFASDGTTANILIPAAAVELHLLTPGPLQSSSFLPGTATPALLQIDAATGTASVSYSFAAAVLLGEPGPLTIAVGLRSDLVGGFLPSFRFCDAPPRCFFVPGEAYDPATGRLLAIGAGTAEAVGSIFLDFDVELSEVPEPGTALLVAAGVCALACVARRRARVLLAVSWMLSTGCDGPIEILSPTPGAVLMAPDVTVELAFAPPLASGESLTASLEAGLDSPAGAPPPEDVTSDLALAADAGSATLALEDLPPGRSRLVIARLAAGGDPIASRALTLDRGGFFGEGGGPFGAGARYEQVARITTAGALRTQDVAIWYPSEDPAALPQTSLELDLRAVLDAPLLAGAQSLPLLLYSHGSCGWEGEVGWLASDLARAGYVVAATSHPGNTIVDVVPCDTGPLLERPLDVLAMLDALLEWNQDASWPLAGAIDPSRVGVGGFSAGGATARLLTLRTNFDPRIRAALVLANAVALPAAVPTMLQGGTLDSFVSIDFMQLTFDVLGPPRFFAAIEGANHRSFANDCLYPFFDCVSGAADREVTHALMRRFARGFFHRYVADDVRGDELLVSVPGADLQQEP